MGSLGPYDLVRPYLHSQGLKWSFGGMLGRDADWQASTAALPAREMLDRVAAIGFDGLLDDFGSTYQGGAASADDISAVLGEKPALSHDLQLGFWDLRAYRRELRDRLGADGVRALRKKALADRTVPAY
jgi:phosphoglycerol transferase